ncbi:ATP-binding protein [Luethyella okanaganae]|uniref:histidine kinase n=1 Tax=Luethyella okanaganae TaxID=69372 RepID=A0ABW1VEY4_9MICO
MRVIRRLSIRARITIGSLIVATLFFAAAAMVMRDQVASILDRATVTLLKDDAAPAIAALENPTMDAIEVPGHGQLVAVVRPDGAIRQSTLPRPLRSELYHLVDDALSPKAVTAGGEDWLVLSQPVTTADGTWHVVTARNEESSALVLQSLTNGLMIAALVLVGGFGIASWLLATAALRPVNRMRRTAATIAAGPSRELLPVGPAHDELSALATTLNTMLTEQRAAADRERQLVSDASHELRTPVAVLQGQLELAHLSTGDADALLGEIESAQLTVRRLALLAGNLLELSRIESGGLGGSSDWAGLSAELAEAVDRARVTAASDATIDFDYGGPLDTGDWVPIDAHDFGRIADNLLSNAVTAVGDVGVVCARLDASAQAITLSVFDDGPGMPEEFMPIAFDRFSRPSQTAGHGGAGLGLSIVAALVHSAGGTVRLENRPEGGLVAEVILPFTATPRRDDPSRRCRTACPSD